MTTLDSKKCFQMFGMGRVIWKDQRVAALGSTELRITQAHGAKTMNHRHLAKACGGMKMTTMWTHRIDLMFGEIGPLGNGESQVNREIQKIFRILVANINSAPQLTVSTGIAIQTETMVGLTNTAITPRIVKTVIVELRLAGSVALDSGRTDGIGMSRNRVRVLGAPINHVDGMLSTNPDIVEIAGTEEHGMTPHHHGDGTMSGKIGINRPQVE